MDDAARAALRELASRVLDLSNTTRRLRAAVEALEHRRTAAGRDDVPGEVRPPSPSTRDDAPAEASSASTRDEAPAEAGAPSGSPNEWPVALGPSQHPRPVRVIAYDASGLNDITVVHMSSEGGS
jgi:hypothetical protein